MKRTLITASLALALLAPAAPALAEDVTPAPIDQAAARYLTYVCPTNVAGSRFARAYNRYDRRDKIGNRPHRKTRAAAKRYGVALQAGAVGLSDPAFVWPVEVADEVRTIAVGFYQDASTAKSISRKRYRWDATEWTDTSQEAASARLALGLPPAPDGC